MQTRTRIYRAKKFQRKIVRNLQRYSTHIILLVCGCFLLVAIRSAVRGSYERDGRLVKRSAGGSERDWVDTVEQGDDAGSQVVDSDTNRKSSRDSERKVRHKKLAQNIDFVPRQYMRDLTENRRNHPSRNRRKGLPAFSDDEVDASDGTASQADDVTKPAADDLPAQTETTWWIESIDATPETSNKLDEEIELRFQRRRERVSEMCEQDRYQLGGYGFLLDQPPWGEFFMDPKRKLAFCRINRVAGSMWQNLFMQLLKDEPAYVCEEPPFTPNCPTRGHQLMMDKFTENGMDFDQTMSQVPTLQGTGWSTLVTIRHPLDRLLSGYITLRNEAPFTFTHFMSKTGQQNNMTFSNYVDYLTTTYDVWENPFTPQHLTCNFCRDNFLYILKLEELNDELPYLRRKLGLDSYLAMMDVRKNANPETEAGDSATRQLAPQYFSQLTSAQLDKLVSRYKNDLYYFDYDAREFYSWVMDAPGKAQVS